MDHAVEPVSPPRARGRIPLGLKLGWTAIAVAVFAGYLAYYSFAASLLWFSSIALLISCVALWRESPLLASMQAVGVVALEFAYTLDLMVRLATGHFVFGLSYYFFQSADSPLWVRCLSLFHLPLPWLLLWMIRRLGYDPRGLRLQTGLAWMLLPTCYFLTDSKDNVNWVFGPGEGPAWMPAWGWMASMMIGFPLAIYWPTHLWLLKFARADR